MFMHLSRSADLHEFDKLVADSPGLLGAAYTSDDARRCYFESKLHDVGLDFPDFVEAVHMLAATKYPEQGENTIMVAAVTTSSPALVCCAAGV